LYNIATVNIGIIIVQLLQLQLYNIGTIIVQYCNCKYLRVATPNLSHLIANNSGSSDESEIGGGLSQY